VPSALPAGEPAPADGRLPHGAVSAAPQFGVYVHVPFCATRCGYCDFNTYTAAELGDGVSRDTYLSVLRQEFAVAGRVLEAARRPASTVFIGGGTPTLLPAQDLAAIVDLVDETFGLSDDVEITTEANPETLDVEYLKTLHANGFTRLSLGMQSTAAHVLAVLERTHTPGRALRAAEQARQAGFAHVNLDLIYGTPGERPADFDASLRAAIDAGADHVSAYSLIVEDGTRLAGQVRRGVLPMPSDDVAADRYLAAERILSSAGLDWYEVSNWAREPSARCRHNLLYWRGQDWWGFGPGAHSHVGGVRWWNVKHPAHYGRLLAAGDSPAAGRELLTDRERHVENVMLRTRLFEGLPVSSLDDHGAAAAVRAATDELLDPAALADGTVRLTLRGRLLADAVVRDLLSSHRRRRPVNGLRMSRRSRSWWPTVFRPWSPTAALSPACSRCSPLFDHLDGAGVAVDFASLGAGPADTAGGDLPDPDADAERQYHQPDQQETATFAVGHVVDGRDGGDDTADTAQQAPDDAVDDHRQVEVEGRGGRRLDVRGAFTGHHTVDKRTYPADDAQVVGDRGIAEFLRAERADTHVRGGVPVARRRPRLVGLLRRVTAR
jgi:putative oxygen-independent coproporphyrinogen III oxidase